MAKSSNQKGKLLVLRRLLLEQTDEEHGLTVPDMIRRLEAEGIHAERKSIYSDLETLSESGLDIVSRKEGTRVLYYVGSRDFELPELKLLVDAVQSSRFITRRKSGQLIEKMAGLSSRWQAKQLQRQVYVANRVKTENESIYYNVDTIYTAIAENRRIAYRYREWGFREGEDGPERQYRRQGKTYCVSPWALCWANDNYYMVGYDSQAESVKHYRVDKMDGIAVSSEPRDGREYFADFDIAVYTRRIFGMFGGEDEAVTLRADNSLLDVILDRFGEEASIRRDGENTFIARVRVAVSPQFLSWVFGFGDRIRILGPAEVVRDMREQTQRVLALYKEI